MKYPEIVLGLGGTVDYEIVWDLASINSLATSLDIRRADLDTSLEITDLRSLIAALLGFAVKGSGGECHVSNSSVLFEIAELFDFKVTLGGTNVRAAIALDKLGEKSLVHLVNIDDNVRRLLPRNVESICSAEKDILEPNLIFQYAENETIKLKDYTFITPKANRVIFAKGSANAELKIHPMLAEAASKSSVFLVSAFNAMTDESKLNNRLSSVRGMCEQATGLVFFEEADYHVHEFQRIVSNQLADVVDVYSMNEEELNSLAGNNGGYSDPKILARDMKLLRDRLGTQNLLVHSANWSCCYGEESDRYVHAIEAAVATASARYMYGDVIDLYSFRKLKEFPRTHKEFCVELQNLDSKIVAVPGYNLDVALPTTIGLGDAFVGGFIYGYLQTQPGENYVTTPKTNS